MKNLSNVLMGTGIVLIGVSAWMWYHSLTDASSLIELRWEVSADAEVGQKTPTSLVVVNRSAEEARVVGLNHC